MGRDNLGEGKIFFAKPFLSGYYYCNFKFIFSYKPVNDLKLT